MAISSYTPSSTRIVHNTEVDFQTRTQLGTTVHLMQYDKSLPIVAVALYSNGQPYQIPTGAEMNVRVGKTDGTKVYNPVLGCNANRTICYFEVTQQMSSAYGTMPAILELILDGAIAGSSYIPLDIAKNPAQDEAILSSNEYKSMNEIVEEAREALGSPPKIQNETWWLWDSDKKAYVDSGLPTRGRTGDTGPQGETGKTGATGAQGIQGIQGEQGEAGNGIASTVLNDDYTLTITFTDGTSYTTPSIRGAVGATGESGPRGLQGLTGDTGAQGPQGETGATGNGISSTVLNSDYTLTINFTNGTSYTTPSIRGATGAQGIQGEKGETGRGFKVLGYYETADSLSAGVSSPTAGDAYGVGTAEPYDIYIWDGINNQWVNNGVLQGAKGEKGEPGATGPKGEQGVKGNTGATGPQGPAGHTPVKGTDYFTDADKSEIAQAAAELVSVPSASSTTPEAPGTASAGTSAAYARGDHVHPRELPTVTASDNGKFLQVVNGAWAAVTISDAEGGSY